MLFEILPADKLSFVLKAGGSGSFKITLESNVVMLQVPPVMCAEWTNTDLVGFEEAVTTGKGEMIRVLVEKDFKCLDGSDVNNEGAYPNPNQYC